MLGVARARFGAKARAGPKMAREPSPTASLSAEPPHVPPPGAPGQRASAQPIRPIAFRAEAIALSHAFGPGPSGRAVPALTFRHRRSGSSLGQPNLRTQVLARISRRGSVQRTEDPARCDRETFSGREDELDPAGKHGPPRQPRPRDLQRAGSTHRDSLCPITDHPARRRAEAHQCTGRSGSRRAVAERSAGTGRSAFG